jgi:ArsR family transcriptional regulator
MFIEPESFFRTLADPTRLRCLILLQEEGELCVCELTHALGDSQPKVSRHLAVLREAGVVTDRRDGRWMYYRINAGLPGWCRAVLRETAGGVAPNVPFRRDHAALCGMADRPGGRCCA